MHSNTDVTEKTLQRLSLTLMGKTSKKNKVAKGIENKSLMPGEKVFINISLMQTRSLGNSKFWTLIVGDYSDHLWENFYDKKSDLSNNTMPILKILFVQ